MRDVLIVLLVALIIVIGGWKFWSYQKSLETGELDQELISEEELILLPEEEAAITEEKGAESPVITIVPEKPKTEVSASKASVKVADQTAGAVAEVAEVFLPASGWVAVRDYKDGKAGNTLGARLFAAGTYSKATVELLRPMISGSNYVAVPLKDNGDGAYKGSDDIPFGEVMAVFKAN